MTSIKWDGVDDQDFNGSLEIIEHRITNNELAIARSQANIKKLKALRNELWEKYEEGKKCHQTKSTK